jgi:hypothetical protein
MTVESAYSQRPRCADLDVDGIYSKGPAAVIRIRKHSKKVSLDWREKMVDCGS